MKHVFRDFAHGYFSDGLFANLKCVPYVLVRRLNFLGLLIILESILTPIELRIDDVFDAHLMFEKMPDRKL